MTRAALDHVEPPYVGDGEPTFDTSRSHAVGEFRCRGCGYGIVAHGRLPICPMCHGAAWAPSPWRPFTRNQGGS